MSPRAKHEAKRNILALPKRAEKEKKPGLLDPEKLNVLVLGAPGSGKSTLVEAIRPYVEADGALELIDAPESSAKLKALRKEPVSIVWYCLDGMQRSILEEDLDGLRQAAKLWPDLPLIAVFTRSLGTDERDVANILMLQDAFAEYRPAKDLALRTKDIICVLAHEFETPLGIVPVRGLDRLMERTRECIPEAQQAASERKVRSVVWDLKRKEANATVAASSALAATIGAVPVSFPDATLLVPVQTAMLAKITRLYDLKDKNAASQISDAALKAGATTIVGRSLLVALKGIPVVGTIGGSVLNAAVAAAVTAATATAVRVETAGITVAEMTAAKVVRTVNAATTTVRMASVVMTTAITSIARTAVLVRKKLPSRTTSRNSSRAQLK